MMVRKSIYLSVLLILNVLFLLTPTVANAQRRPSLPKVKEDSIPFFRGVAVGVDLVGPAMRWLASYAMKKIFFFMKKNISHHEEKCFSS